MSGIGKAPILFASLALFFFLTPVQADRLVYKNGSVVTGEVIQQNRQFISIKKLDGTILQVKKAELRRIMYRGERAEPIQKSDSVRLKKEEKRERQKQDLSKSERVRIDPDIKKIADPKPQPEKSRKPQPPGPQEKQEIQRGFQKNAPREAKIWSLMHRDQRFADSPPVEKSAEATNQKGPATPELLPGMMPLDSGPTRTGALWRSLVLPGWGQLYQGRNDRGIAYLGSYAVAVAGAGAAFAHYTDVNRQYNQAADQVLYSMVIPVMGLSATLPGGLGSLFDPHSQTPFASPIPGLSLATLYYSMDSNAARSRVLPARNAAIGAAGTLGAIYLIGALDALIFHPSGEEQLSLQADFRNGPGIRLTYRF